MNLEEAIEYHSAEMQKNPPPPPTPEQVAKVRAIFELSLLDETNRPTAWRRP